MYRYLNSLLCYLNFFYDIPKLISRVHYMLSLGVIKRTVGKFVSKNNACILFIYFFYLHESCVKPILKD